MQIVIQVGPCPFFFFFVLRLRLRLVEDAFRIFWHKLFPFFWGLFSSLLVSSFVRLFVRLCLTVSDECVRYTRVVCVSVYLYLEGGEEAVRVSLSLSFACLFVCWPLRFSRPVGRSD